MGWLPKTWAKYDTRGRPNGFIAGESGYAWWRGGGWFTVYSPLCQNLSVESWRRRRPSLTVPADGGGPRAAAVPRHGDVPREPLRRQQQPHLQALLPGGCALRGWGK